MKKFCGFIFCLFLSTATFAQQPDIPLFEDDLPNLGRQAKPLGEIHLGPEELPDMKVSLDTRVPPPPAPAKTESKPKISATEKPAPKAEKTPPKKPAPLPDTPQRTSTISLGKQLTQEKSAELNKQLNAEIQRYQEARAKAELERQAQLRAQEEKGSEEVKAPESLTDLFGHLHDVHGFEISGFALGMTPEEVAETASENGYSITKVEHGIPLHRTSFYEHRCRGAQVHRVRDLQDCIIDQARNDEVYYISSVTMAKPATAEYIQILFSSHATDNVSYKIYYENKGDNSLNFTRKNFAKKIRRRDAFWNRVFETYGYPDDKDLILWGDPQKAYMLARMQGSNYNAYLVLEDKEIPDGDYKDATEQKEDLRYRHTFTFAPLPEDEE